MDAISVGLVAVIILCGLIYSSRRTTSKKKLPPSPISFFSLLFYIFFMKKGKKTMEYRYALSQGELYSMNIGEHHIFLNSYRAIQEAFVGQADIFSGRMKNRFTSLLNSDKGIVGSDGPVWQVHRRFMMRTLREFGLGKSIVIDIIQDELQAMADRLKKNERLPTETYSVFSATTCNVIARLCFGERTGTEDEEFQTFSKHLSGSFEDSKLNVLAFLCPFILYLPYAQSLVPTFYHTRKVNEYIMKKVKDTEKALSAVETPITDASQACNICEATLMEKACQERDNPGQHTFNDLQIIRNMVDLFIAGSETTATTLTWTVLLLAINPDIQDRLQNEIKDSIGLHKLPSMADRQTMPYTSAVIDEVLRYSSIVPTNVHHRTTQDTVLLGYDIPANTLVNTNLFAIHHDPNLWENPDSFFPGHFLTTDGKYKSSKYLMPFSVGKRACLGESLAKSELFIFIVGLMQQFEVKLADPSVDIEALLEGQPKFIRQPLHHHIIFSCIVA